MCTRAASTNWSMSNCLGTGSSANHAEPRWTAGCDAQMLPRQLGAACWRAGNYTDTRLHADTLHCVRVMAESERKSWGLAAQRLAWLCEAEGKHFWFVGRRAVVQRLLRRYALTGSRG